MPPKASGPPGRTGDVAAAAELQLRISEFTRIWTSAAVSGQQAYGPKPSVRRRLEMVEHLSKALRVLTKQGQLYRRAEAQSLYAEGLTMAELSTPMGW